MENIKKMKLCSNLLVLGLLLSAVACGSCDDDKDDDKKNDDKKNEDKKEEKKTLKFTITGKKIENAITKNASKSDTFEIEVTEGEDKTDEYRIKLGMLETFRNSDYASGGVENGAKKVRLIAPVNGATLKSLGVGDTLKKGDKKDIKFIFKAGTGVSVGSSQIDVSIIDKDGKVVGGPVKLQWNHHV
jgi:hypothetical protein